MWCDDRNELIQEKPKDCSYGQQNEVIPENKWPQKVSIL